MILIVVAAIETRRIAVRLGVWMCGCVVYACNVRIFLPLHHLWFIIIISAFSSFPFVNNGSSQHRWHNTTHCQTKRKQQKKDEINFDARGGDERETKENFDRINSNTNSRSSTWMCLHTLSDVRRFREISFSKTNKIERALRIRGMQREREMKKKTEALLHMHRLHRAVSDWSTRTTVRMQCSVLWQSGSSHSALAGRVRETLSIRYKVLFRPCSGVKTNEWNFVRRHDDKPRQQQQTIANK